jgi:hypothetical protein
MAGRRAAVGAGLAVLVAAAALWARLPPTVPAAWRPALIGIAWVSFGIGAWLVHGLPRKVAIPLILAGAVVLLVGTGLGPPRSSDDLYRYLWDGRVQAAGIDPYRYVPAAPELAKLRDDFLWPATSNWCVVDGCTLINRPTVPTIYPPAAQLLFLLLYGVSPAGAGAAPAQVMGAVFALAVTVLLLVRLPDPRRAVLWAWCPLVPLEAASNGHIDVAAALLTVAALLVFASGKRPGLGGALLGLAVAVKVTPLAVVPAVLRRRPWVVLASLSTVVLVAYLPHLVAVGPGALGYLGGYAREEGYTKGWSVVAVLVLAGVSAWAWRTSKEDRPWDAAALTTGALLLVTAPAYPWYATLLVALVGLGARVEWLAVAAAGYVVQYAGELHVATATAQRAGYGLAGLIVLGGWWFRRGRPDGARRPPRSTGAAAPAAGQPATTRG